MFKEKRLNLIFLVVNLLLIFSSLFFLKNWTFSAIDDWITKQLYPNFFVDKNVKWVNDVVLVKIDKKFFDEMGVTTWTFHRWYYAQLLEKLNSWWVKNVSFDVFFWKLVLGTGDKAQKYFNATVKYFNQQLIKALSGNVVLWVIPSDNWKLALPSKNYLDKGVWLGYVQSHTNKNQINDGVVPFKNDVLTLWLATYLNKLYLNWVIWKKLDIRIQKWKKFLFSWFNLSPDYLLINTTNPNIKFKIPLSKDVGGNDYLFVRIFTVYPKYSYSLADILQNKIQYPESIFSDKTVFVGATDNTLNDVKVSYLGLIPGVSFHMNSFLSAYSKIWTFKAPLGRSFLIIVMLFVIWYLFVILWRDQLKSFVAFVSLSGAVFIGYIILFNAKWIIIPVWTILFLFFIKLLLDILHILLITGINKEKFKKWFSTYVGQMVLEKKEKLWETKMTERKKIALMFTDIASFTNISEKLTAPEVVEMLNTYFEEANFALKWTQIYVDKYIWDAIMAFWENKPNFDLIAKNVIKFQKLHKKIKEIVYDRIWKHIDLKTRIWLHYWEAVVWEVGDSSKLNYTAIGDNVNLASRLEGINKYYWTRVIMSEDFYNQINQKHKFAIRLLDKITVKWKTQPVKIYELMLFSENEITDEIRKYIKDWQIWLDYYFEGKFDLAKNVFEELLNTEFWKNDKTLKIFLERIDYLLKNPPENWDGVWRFSTK